MRMSRPGRTLPALLAAAALALVAGCGDEATPPPSAGATTSQEPAPGSTPARDDKVADRERDRDRNRDGESGAAKRGDDARGDGAERPAPKRDADADAKRSLRQMVSVIEGCRSGRESYRECTTHEDLGSAALIGETIGDGPGEVSISGTGKETFRMTARSRSGVKFTIARSPKGERRRCTPPGKGACPASGDWDW